VPKAVKLSSIAVLFAAGVLLGATVVGGGRAAGTATTVTDATTVPADTTTGQETPPTTVVETETVQRTTTRILPVPTTQATTSTASDTEGTPAWVWVLLAILAAGLIALIVVLARRGKGTASVEERRRHLDAAVASWTAQGWAIQSQTADSAVLRRGAESMLVSVEPTGHVRTTPLPSA
jgi:hypothetical protein